MTRSHEARGFERGGQDRARISLAAPLDLPAQLRGRGPPVLVSPVMDSR